jgi:hypothetical protein
LNTIDGGDATGKEARGSAKDLIDDEYAGDRTGSISWHWCSSLDDSAEDDVGAVWGTLDGEEASLM